uniref:FLZ-type domain-containing protein n=1 Tax=Zea mays TaxID=4577 RepID=B6TP13_MAIZE|nr:hypothetical protein [Zea mays]
MATSVACAFFFFDAADCWARPGGGKRWTPASLCSKPLARNSDIFMYRGDTPFCSEDCRYEQMHHDAAAATAYARQQASSRRRQQRSRGGSVSANEADVYVAS